MKNKEMTREEWVKLVEKRLAMCYIKPTRLKHESGFRCFELGYCTIGNDNKVDKKFVLSNWSDHMHTDFMQLLGWGVVPLNMDLTLDGHIRIWGSEKHIVKWEGEGMVVSSVALTTKELQQRKTKEFKKMK
jgi:hypothetical protein